MLEDIHQPQQCVASLCFTRNINIPEIRPLPQPPKNKTIKTQSRRI